MYSSILVYSNYVTKVFMRSYVLGKTPNAVSAPCEGSLVVLEALLKFSEVWEIGYGQKD